MKTKSLLLTAIFSLLLVSGAWAQEKYEFAMVKCIGSQVIFSTKEKTEDLKIEKGEDQYTTVLKKVSELNEGGWEVYSNSEATTGQGGRVFTYYLRKKKN